VSDQREPTTLPYPPPNSHSRADPALNDGFWLSERLYAAVMKRLYRRDELLRGELELTGRRVGTGRRIGRCDLTAPLRTAA
jgi:hypothetical protein